MYQAKREMENYERRKVYHRAYYSLNAYSWLENYALEPVSYTHLDVYKRQLPMFFVQDALPLVRL